MNANLSANSSHQKHFTEQQHVFVSGTLAFFTVKETRRQQEAGNFCVRHRPDSIHLQRVLISVKFRHECRVSHSMETQTMARSPWLLDWWRRVSLHRNHRIEPVCG